MDVIRRNGPIPEGRVGRERGRSLGEQKEERRDNSRRTTSYSADAGRAGSPRVVASSATPLGQAGIAENVGRSIDKVDSCGWHIIAAVWSDADLTGEVIFPFTSLLRNRLQGRISLACPRGVI